MASEYEIREVGFVGSIWNGVYIDPILVGRTIEVTNVPNTIESGGIKKSVFYATNYKMDLSKLNKQSPDKSLYYEITHLDESTIDSIFLDTKVSKEYLKRQRVLCRFDAKMPPGFTKSIMNSRIPIQENWSFNTQDPNNPIYIYNRPETIVEARFIILVESQSDLEKIIEYYTNIQSTESIFDPPVIANPPAFTEFADSTLYPDAEYTSKTGDRPPPSSFRITAFETPVADVESFAQEEAGVLFEQSKYEYEAFDINTLNGLIKQAEGLRNYYLDVYQNIKSSSPFTDKFETFKNYYFNELVLQYLQQQLDEISGANETDQPTYIRDEEDNYVLIPTEGAATGVVDMERLEEDIRNLDEFDEYIDEIIEDLTVDDNNTYIFKKVSKVSDYSLPILKNKTYGLFKCSGEKLSTFHTGGLDDVKKRYFTSVYNKQFGTHNSFHQFDVSYGHISGSGSTHIVGEIDLLPAKTMYHKYLMECFDGKYDKFKFKNDKNGDYFYVIQLDRDAMKDKLDPGNFEIALCPLSGSANQSYNTGSNYFAKPNSDIIYTLIDESKDTMQRITDNQHPELHYYITSGSLRDGIYGEPEDDAWGIVFPNLGIIVLDGVVLDQSCSFNTVTGSKIDGDNSRKLMVSLSGSACGNDVRQFSSSFFARSAEASITETYFCRAEYNEFNYSTNYTYTTSDDANNFKFNYFKKKPHSYITSIGLYNRRKELIAVGKIKRPILKNEGKTYIFQVKVKLN